MLKKVMKARDARASDEASPLLVCSFTTFLAEYSAPYNLEPALHRCLTSLEYHKMEKPTELGKRNATSVAHPHPHPHPHPQVHLAIGPLPRGGVGN